ncbi:hypothetical protein NQ317_016273 [Molorchus minor]|uniref:DDE Tnp4 domain-containing protein n=1 Tax=Molorchus minor TaxID=1323400 RepID=A0ABQ9JZ79_9CUCU|nr:hypothetical protein NQ317_016273 [Molorchus minor]
MSKMTLFLPVPRNILRDNSNPFERYSNSELLQRIRFSRDVVDTIIRPIVFCNGVLSSMNFITNYVIVKIHKNPFQKVCGALLMLSQSTVCRIVSEVSERLARSLPRFVVASPQCEILDIVIRWPGSAHDSRIFNSSSVCLRLEAGNLPGILLGDSAYAQTRYVYTPLLAPANRAEQRYNNAHIHTRNVVERTFGILKKILEL